MYEPPGTVILRGEVGSTLHGTAVGGQDDRDEMAVVVADRQYVTGLKRWESHVWRSKPDGVRSEAGDLDLTYYELRRFVELAMRGNPSILLLLYVPLGKLVSSTPRGIGLQQLAPEIVSMQTVPRYRGYMKSQAPSSWAARSGPRRANGGPTGTRRPVWLRHEVRDAHGSPGLPRCRAVRRGSPIVANVGRRTLGVPTGPWGSGDGR